MVNLTNQVNHMNNKYELWGNNKDLGWCVYRRGNDLENLRKQAKVIKANEDIELKLFAVERFEQPL